MGKLSNIGIEKIRVYPASMKLHLTDLANVRQYDVQHMHQELMVYERGLNPVWEDALTMAVNAANPMLTEADRNSIGLLIVGTETGLDQEKSLSSWAHYFLDLPSSCRHFEIKGACYSGTAALKMAASWLASGYCRPGQKALIITTDQSLHALHKPWEYIGGAAAVAMIISDQPDFLALEQDKFGIYSHEVTDVIRPLPWIETGNSEYSLFSYMEGLTGSYDDYVEHAGPIDFDEFFDYNVYHVPFSGISYRAHKQLMRLDRDPGNEAILDSFMQKTKPSIQDTGKIGGSYGSSVFITLASLVRHAPRIRPGDRIGIFSYGSGSCAEFYSALVGPKAPEVIAGNNLGQLLEERYNSTVREYEAIENQRVEMSKSEDFVPDRTAFKKVYEQQYEGQGKLIFKSAKGYYRTYEFS